MRRARFLSTLCLHHYPALPTSAPTRPCPGPRRFRRRPSPEKCPTETYFRLPLAPRSARGRKCIAVAGLALALALNQPPFYTANITFIFAYVNCHCMLLCYSMEHQSKYAHNNIYTFDRGLPSLSGAECVCVLCKCVLSILWLHSQLVAIQRAQFEISLYVFFSSGSPDTFVCVCLP